ncbi:MAG: amino acid ABC transporter permease [Pseudomonadota bacterium]
MFGYTFQWGQAVKWLPQMLEGAWVTMEIAILSMLIGIAVAILFTSFRQTKSRILNGIVTTWVEIARNTPALFQIYMAHFGIASFGIHFSPFVSLLIGITFNNVGYLTENFRGAMKAIPDTQTRAARSLGLSAPQAFAFVVMPQMLRIAFLPASNQMVWAILMTSLGVTVGMNSDLYGVTQDLNSVTFRTFELFAIAAVIFYVITKTIQIGARLLAARLFRY